MPLYDTVSLPCSFISIQPIGFPIAFLNVHLNALNRHSNVTYADYSCAQFS